MAGRPRIPRDWRQVRAAGTDWWLAAAFAGLAFLPPMSAVSAEIGDLHGRPSDAFSIILVLGQTVTLALRRRRPATCLAVVGLCFAVYELRSYPTEFGTITVYLALYSAGAHQRRFRRALTVTASVGYVAFCVMMAGLGSPDGTSGFLIYYLVLAACWALGAYVREGRSGEADRQRRAAAAAAAAERAHIARELHDVVTHHVTAMVVQADAAQFVPEAPDRVRTALAAIGESGRLALAELRYLLDVLTAAHRPSGRPAPPGRSVRALVEQSRRSGQPVELVEDGDQAVLSSGVGLTVYRVVQEGLTNAAKYAAGRPTTVRVGYRNGQVGVEVVSAAAALLPVAARRDWSGGHGLSGLRERVGMLGGELTAGEQADGRFLMRAVIPLGGPP
jgi:signal transduction histidine kinase